MLVKIFGLCDGDHGEKTVSSFVEKASNLFSLERPWFGFFGDVALRLGTDIPLLVEIRFLGEERKKIELGEELKKSLEKAIKEAFDRETIFC